MGKVTYHGIQIGKHIWLWFSYPAHHAVSRLQQTGDYLPADEAVGACDEDIHQSIVSASTTFERVFRNRVTVQAAWREFYGDTFHFFNA